MKHLVSLIVVLFMLFPFQAQARAHKCAMPDGTTAFQDAPCPSGAASSDVEPLVVTPQPENQADARRELARAANGSDSAASRAQKQRDEENKAKNAEIYAYNKRVRCNNARQQLSVAKAQRPVYSLDNDGNRHYVDDSDRAALTSAAEREVAAACN